MIQGKQHCTHKPPNIGLLLHLNEYLCHYLLTLKSFPTICCCFCWTNKQKSLNFYIEPGLSISTAPQKLYKSSPNDLCTTFGIFYFEWWRDLNCDSQIKYSAYGTATPFLTLNDSNTCDTISLVDWNTSKEIEVFHSVIIYASMSFQTSVTFFLLLNPQKNDILRNFFFFFPHRLEVSGHQYGLVTNILHNVLVCILQKKERRMFWVCSSHKAIIWRYGGD